MSWHPNTVEQIAMSCLLIEFKEYLMRIDAMSRSDLLQQCENILANPQKFLHTGANTDMDLAHISACGTWISTVRKYGDVSAKSPVWDTLHTNFLYQCTPFMELVAIILGKKL